MKDESFLNSLADFTDLKYTARPEMMEIQNRPRQGYHSNASSNPRSQMSAEQELELRNNDKLIRNFKDLKEQLRESGKTSQKLLAKLGEKQMEVERLRISQREYITQNHQLRNQIEHLKHANQDSRAKLDMLKGLAKSTSQADEEIEYLKITINDLKNKISDLEAERARIMEISILDKVELEQKIQRFEAKKSSDIQYVQGMEIEVSKLREKCMKMETEYKKLQISYDQELYNRQWANGSFEKEHLRDQLQQALSENEDLLAKHKKEKERRNSLERRVLELEESTGIWVVKAETYEIENRALQKKYKKMEKRMESIKEQADKKVGQILGLEQKFAKSIAISEQLIARAKRQIQGDIVALAKSCEFKINKLKQDKDNFIKEIQKNNKAADKARSVSKKNEKVVKNCEQIQPKTQAKPAFGFWHDRSEKSLCKTSQNLSEKPTEKKQANFDSRRSLNPLAQIDNIELRIKKQRDQMQRKIRQKMLYRKLQVASSPEKHQLREDYFKLFDH